MTISYKKQHQSYVRSVFIGKATGDRRLRRRRMSSTYRVEFPWRRSRRLTSHAAVEFFRAATVAFNVQFFDDAITELLMFIYSFIQYKKSKHGTRSMPHYRNSPIYLLVLYNRPT